MDVASLIASQAMRVDASAAMSASSTSREKVAMPHWRGGHVATNATESGLAVAVIKIVDTSISVADLVGGRARLVAQPVRDVRHACGDQSQAGISGSGLQTQLAILGCRAT